MRYLESILVAALVVASAAAPAAWAQGQERCYGIALAGANDGIDGREAAGSATVDYQGNAWVWVPTGTCGTQPLPVQADGTPRRGAIGPLDRDRP